MFVNKGGTELIATHNVLNVKTVTVPWMMGSVWLLASISLRSGGKRNVVSLQALVS